MMKSRIGVIGTSGAVVRLVADQLDTELIDTEDRRSELEVLADSITVPSFTPYAFGKEPRVKDTGRKTYALAQEKKNRAIKKVNMLRVRIKSKHLTEPKQALALITEYEKNINLLGIQPHPDIEIIKGELYEKLG